MPLRPAFTISGASPSHFGIDPASPDSPYLNAFLTSYGGYTSYTEARKHSLPDQLANDTLIIGRDVAHPDDERDITDFYDAIYSRAAYRVVVHGYNVTADHQYLLVFEMRRPLYSYMPVMQFFVGTEWLRSVAVENFDEKVALLLDIPGPGSVCLYARLASYRDDDLIALSGVEGFIL